MAAALVATVGNTPAPIVKAVEEVCSEENEVHVFLIYGRPFDGQDPSPFDIAMQVADAARSLGATPHTPYQIDNPEELDTCLAVTRQVFSEVASFERVVVNFTGGTKPMSAAAVHVALSSPISGQLFCDYTGGQTREKGTGRVVPEAMQLRRSERTWTDEQIRLVIEALGSCNYPRASVLSSGLPDRGRASFVKEAAQSLALWDAFLYEEAANRLARQHAAANALLDDAEVESLAGCVLRLHEAGRILAPAVRELRKAEHGGIPSLSEEAQALLIADAVENSRRKLTSGEATEAVLRAYRAVEVATQMGLIRLGINPWRPDWKALEPAICERIRKRLRRDLPDQLALASGLDVLRECGFPASPDFDRNVRDLQQMRNRSFLEHGYQSIGREDAIRLHSVAADLCAQLSGADLQGLLQRVRHLGPGDTETA
ncbi:MAG: TIGR02710 family CRISPR-associated CARF protein [Armatimonadota bacterium]